MIVYNLGPGTSSRVQKKGLKPKQPAVRNPAGCIFPKSKDLFFIQGRQQICQITVIAVIIHSLFESRLKGR